MNKKFAVLASFLLLFTGTAFAASNDTTTINYSVAAINELSLSGSPAAFNISSAIAGQGGMGDLRSDMETSTTLDLTTNGASKKITVELSKDLPYRTLVQMTIGTSGYGPPANLPDGWGSQWVELYGTEAKMVAWGGPAVGNDICILYNFISDIAAGIFSSSATITYTLMDQ